MIAPGLTERRKLLFRPVLLAIVLAVPFDTGCSSLDTLSAGIGFRHHNEFDRLVEQATTALQTTAPGYTSNQASRLAEAVHELNFAGLIVLLAGKSFAEPTGTDFVEDAASAVHGEFGAHPSIDRQRITALLRHAFRKLRRPSDIEMDPAMRHMILESGLKHLSDRANLPHANKEEIAEIIRLLETGAFSGDASDVTQAVYGSITGFPDDALGMLQDPGLARWPADTLRALCRDARSTSPANGTTPVLQETLREFQELPPAGRTAAMLRGVLARENRTVRLALILYARSHGVSDIDDDAIDKVVLALDPTHPDLRPLLLDAADRLKTGYGPSQASMEVRRLR
jgi:hypothetical protein